MTSPQTTESTETVTGVVLTPTAARKAKALLDQEGRDDLRLRIAVQPGGCSGLRYQLFFDERDLDGDVVAWFSTREESDAAVPDDEGDAGEGKVGVVTDRHSRVYLEGATINFVDRIDAQGFTIDNPNAQGSCACGDSFH